MSSQDQFGRLPPHAGTDQVQQHEQNASSDSHLRQGGIFDPANPNRKQPKLTVLADGEDPAEVLGDRVDRRNLRRKAEINKMVEDALVNRVEPPVGNQTMKVNFQQFVNMRKDPEFEPFSKYGQSLLFYTNGKPRPVPIRPLVANEVGMYRGKFVVLDRLPDDSARGDVPYVQVTTQLERPQILVEPDPFPSSKREEVTAVEPIFEVFDGGTKE